jgi:hypothetical protein
MKRWLFFAGVVCVSTATSFAALAQSGQMDGSTYTVRLGDVRSRAEQIHDEVQRSIARLRLLTDAYTHGDRGARAEVALRNEMSGAFVMTSVRLSIDDRPAIVREGADLADAKSVSAHSGSIAPGDHVVHVVVTYRGNGAVLPYLRGYKFELTGSHNFTVAPGQSVRVVPRAFERGDMTTPFEQRPALEWIETSQALPTVAR